MEPSKIGLLFNGVWSQYAFAKATKYRDLYRLLYVHDLEEAQLHSCQALVIPFQSDHQAIAQRKAWIYDFLAAGKKVFVEGDSSANWLEAQWEDRPVNNYWWVKDPQNPPVSECDRSHPIYRDLSPRHSFWHYHGVYAKAPDHARIIQKTAKNEIVTWETSHYGGALLVSTLDPIVEHGVQQITHLDHYCDALTEWLVGVRPEGAFQVLDADYGITWP